MNIIIYDKLNLFNSSFLFINKISLGDAKNGLMQPANTIIIPAHNTIKKVMLFASIPLNNYINSSIFLTSLS